MSRALLNPPNRSNMAKTKKVKSETDTNKMAIYAVIVLVLIVVLVWALKKGSVMNNTPNTPAVVDTNPYPVIGSSGDLNKASGDLDTTDLNNIDKGLQGLSADSSSI